MIQNYEIPGSKPADLQVYKDKTMLLTMIDDSGKRRPILFHRIRWIYKGVFEFIDRGTNINVAANANLLAYTDSNGTHLNGSNEVQPSRSFQMPNVLCHIQMESTSP